MMKLTNMLAAPACATECTSCGRLYDDLPVGSDCPSDDCPSHGVQQGDAPCAGTLQAISNPSRERGS